jgi:hypothetical protein
VKEEIVKKKTHRNTEGRAGGVKKKRRPESRLGRIENIAIGGVQGTARGTSLITGHVERPIENVTISGVRLRMLAEERPDKRATDAMVIERVNNLTIRDVEVDWDHANAEPAWGSALVLRDIRGLVFEGFRGRSGRGGAGVPAIRSERVEEHINRE